MRTGSSGLAGMSGMGSSNENVWSGREARPPVDKQPEIWQFLLPHLPPCSLDDGSPADVFAIGFEEMVELSAGNIVNAR